MWVRIHASHIYCQLCPNKLDAVVLLSLSGNEIKAFRRLVGVLCLVRLLLLLLVVGGWAWSGYAVPYFHNNNVDQPLLSSSSSLSIESVSHCSTGIINM